MKLKRWHGVLLAVVVLLVAFRLYLPTLVKDFANKELNRDPHYAGNVEDIDLHILRGAYTARGLSIERIEGKKRLPFIKVGAVTIGVSWHELFRFHLVTAVAVRNFLLDIVTVPAPDQGKDKVVGAPSKEEAKEKAQDWHVAFRRLIPFKVDSLTVDGDSIHFRDLTSHPQVDVYLDQLQIRGSNFTNSTKVSNSLFGTIDFHARMMKSGALHLTILINPLVVPPEFKITTELKNLSLVDLNQFFEAYGKFDVKQGEFSLYSEMATAHNELKGYFKPIVKHLKVTDFEKDKKKGVLHVVWEDIVGAVGAIFKNHYENEQAAEVPFTGRLDGPKPDIWAGFVSILKNIFIQPIAPKLDHTVDLKDVTKK